MAKTYRDLYPLVVAEINKRVGKEIITVDSRYSVQPSGEGGSIDARALAEIVTTIVSDLADLIAPRIISGLDVTATTPESDSVLITAGTGTSDGRKWELSNDITLKIPFDASTYVFYIILYNNALEITRTHDDTKCEICKITVPQPGITSAIVDDKPDDGYDAWIISAKDIVYDEDQEFDDASVEKLRDVIGRVLADNLIGNIKLSENLKITNTQGSLEIDSSAVKILSENDTVLAKFNRNGTFFYDDNGIEIAKFSVDEARVGNIIVTQSSIQSENFVTGNLGAGFRIKDSGDAEFNNVLVRGKLASTVFEKDTISAVGGNLLVIDADILDADMDSNDSYDSYTKLMLHCDGENNSTTFVDETGKAVTNTEAYDSNTKLMLHCDGVDGSTTFTDETGKAVTANGNVQIDTAQSIFGGASILFDGVGDYLYLADSDDWHFGTEDFTIEFRVRFSSITNEQRIVAQRADANNRWFVSKRATADGNKLTLFFTSGGVIKGQYTMTNAWSGCATNTWYHLVFVRNGTTALIFIDGVSQTLTANTAFGTNDVGNITSNLLIGTEDGTIGELLTGWMDELRISKGVARWTTNFTPNSIPYGRALVTTLQSVFGGACAAFSGGGDYLALADSDDWDFGTSDFTIDFWVRFTDYTQNQTFFDIGDISNNKGAFLYYDGTRVYLHLNGVSVLDRAISFSNNTWYHIAVSRNGADLRLFLNSIQQGATVTNSTNIDASTYGVAIGARNYATRLPLLGWLDEFRVSKSIARWTSNFTVPTSAYGSSLTISGDTSFVRNDILRIKDGTDDEWIKVIDTASAPTYITSRDQASAYALNQNPVWKKGTTVVKYGQSGAGGVYLTSSEANAPFISIISHGANPWSSINTHLRLGNLNGFLGYTTDKYGIAIGELTKYLKYDPDNGLRLAGNTLLGNLSVSTNGYINAGQTAYNTGIGYWLEYNNGTPRISIGNPSGNNLTWDGTNLTITGSITVTGGNASRTFYQATAPSGVGEKEGDYWIDSDASNALYVYQSSSWALVSSGGGGITTFRQATVPTAVTAGDLWIDTDDNKLYRATNAGDDQITAGEWELQNAAIATGWSHGSDTTKIDGGDIYTGTVTADAISVAQLSAITANLGTITAGSVTGATIQTSGAGSRVVMNATNLRAYDTYAEEMFNLEMTGANAGDVTIGNYNSGAGIKWDRSAFQFNIKGAVTATSGNFTGTVNVGAAGRVYIDGASEVVRVYDESNNLRVELGKLS